MFQLDASLLSSMCIDDSNTERKGTSDVVSHVIKQAFKSPECEEGHFVLGSLFILNTVP